MRKPRVYTYNNKPYTSAELAKIAGCTSNCMRCRIHIRNGVVTDDILVKKMPGSGSKVVTKLYKYKDKKYSIKQIAKITGVSYCQIWQRIKKTGGIINDYVMTTKGKLAKKYYITDVDNEVLTLYALAKKYDVDARLVRHRYHFKHQYRDPKKLTARPWSL